MSGPRIRVLFVVPTLSIGGVERIITNLLPAIDRERFDVSLICTGEEGELFPSLVARGIEAKALNIGGTRNAPKSLSKLSEHIKITKPDVVVTSGAGTALNARLAALLNGVRNRVLWVHQGAEFGSRNPIRKLSERWLTPFTSHFLGVAEAQVSFMSSRRSYPIEKIRIIRTGIDVDLFRNNIQFDLHDELGLTRGRPTVAMVARLHPVKDHPTFLNAARIVLDRLPETEFLIVGDGPRRGELESLCKELGIEENVHFTGPRSDIDRLLPSFDIHVLSSHSEALPLAVLEGMACGKPVVCTEVGGTTELVEDGVSGFLVAPGNPVQLADRLITLLTKPDLARQVGESARSRIELDFKLSDSVAATEKFLEGMVRSGGRIEPPDE